MTRGVKSESQIAARSARSRSKQPPLIVPNDSPSSLMTARAPARRYVEPLVEMTVASTPRFFASMTRFAAAMVRVISCILVDRRLRDFNRQRAHALAGRGKDRVRECRGHAEILEIDVVTDVNKPREIQARPQWF